LVLAGILLSFSISTLAHHSFTSFWHVDKKIEVTGMVTSVKLVNPHPEIRLEVTEANGQKSVWVVTGTATGTAIIKAGWSASTVPVGTTVRVEGYPSRREGAKAVAAGKITKPDGSIVWFGGGGGIPQG
jgi:hypothetical protein